MMKIGVLCSGGDAPGMNPCLRSIVRAGEKYGDCVVGILHGYQGIFDEEFWGGMDRKIDRREVSGLTNRGGSLINSSRCERMTCKEGLAEAAQILSDHRFDALLVVGGNGSLTGAHELGKYWDGQIVGLPGTIDNDLLGTDFTIGFATAVQTGVEAIDKLRDTAGSHNMMFIVEVMGRHCGDLATHIALAGGCEEVAVPETKTSIKDIVKDLRQFKALGKRSIIMVVAEGDDFGNSVDIMKALKESNCPYDMRNLVLGHLQRGGTPVPADRVLATKLGCFAIDALHEGETGKMVGEIASKLVLTTFEEVLAERRNTAVAVEQLIRRMSI
jgi:6-phosphofructokinase 1